MTEAVEIRETTVTPTDGGVFVQLHISDVPKNSENATLIIAILAKLPGFETPLVAHLQREAMKRASDVLRAHLQDMASEINNAGHDLNPKQAP